MTRLFAAVMILTAAAVAVADETPNINPGLWKHDTTMTFMGDFPIPDQEQSEEQCVTAEEVAKGGNFLDDVGEECDITRQEIRRDGMNLAMTCAQQGMQVSMTADMNFNGDQVDGMINSEMETPMGPMQARIEISGQRVGDCD